MERKRCWKSHESASRPAALIAFYFYTLLPPSYASQLVATGTPDSIMGTNTFSPVSLEKEKKKKRSGAQSNRRPARQRQNGVDGQTPGPLLLQLLA